MTKYVVTKKAFVNGALRRPGEEVDLDHKPSWAVEKTKGKEPAKKEKKEKKEKKDKKGPSFPEGNPTVQL